MSNLGAEFLMPADMLKDRATEQELYWMTEEEFEREEQDEAAMDPNAVIDVKELAHRRHVKPLTQQTSGACSWHV